jgi:AcrR family transcriptional regulator
MATIAKQSKGFIQDTREHIVDTARQLFSEYSYLGASMSDIAKKLNITKAALYYHFSGKAEIYEKVLNEVFNDLNFAISLAFNEPTTDKKLQKLIINYLDFGLREKNLIKAFMLKLSPDDSHMTKHIAKLRKQIVSSIYPIIKEVSVSKKLTQKIDCQMSTSLLTSLMDGLLLEYSFFNKKIDSVKISNQIIAVLF